MHMFVLQRLTTIRNTFSSSVIQDESDWLDLEGYQDVVFWIECREATGSPTIGFRTSPTRDDDDFVLILPAVSLVASATPTLVNGTLANANVPVARFVRWQMTGTGPWDATFRVEVAANRPGA